MRDDDCGDCFFFDIGLLKCRILLQISLLQLEMGNLV